MAEQATIDVPSIKPCHDSLLGINDLEGIDGGDEGTEVESEISYRDAYYVGTCLVCLSAKLHLEQWGTLMRCWCGKAGDILSPPFSFILSTLL